MGDLRFRGLGGEEKVSWRLPCAARDLFFGSGLSERFWLTSANLAGSWAPGGCTIEEDGRRHCGVCAILWGGKNHRTGENSVSAMSYFVCSGSNISPNRFAFAAKTPLERSGISESICVPKQEDGQYPATNLASRRSTLSEWCTSLDTGSLNNALGVSTIAYGTNRHKEAVYRV